MKNAAVRNKKMAEENGIYRCELCGNVASVIEAYSPNLVCCGQEMSLLTEKSGDEGLEKHVPIIEKSEGGVLVKVGSIPHPMTEEHYIHLIQLVSEDGVVIGKRLKPGDSPQAEFCCLVKTDGLKARALCNLHGLWKSE
jgi:superoxide reductase